MHGAAPYLSLVVTARNDDHGGNLLRRMQIFVNAWIAQARRHHLSSELIVVEWNPPSGRARLWEALSWPEDFGPCEVRFIEVPSAIHHRYANAAALPLYQMIAKNAGIRRARGRFILATNIDIVFSDELIRFLADQDLCSGRTYRIDRHDVMNDVPLDADVDRQLEYCRTHLLRLNSREGTFPTTPEGKLTLENGDIAAADSGLVFGRGWFSVERYSEEQVFRHMAADAEIEWTFPNESRPVLCIDLEPGPSSGGRSIEIEIIERDQPPARERIHGRSQLRIYFSPGGTSARRLQLKVKGGGDPLENDPRILACRVFSCRWERCSSAQPHVRSRLEVQAVSRDFVRNIRFLWWQMQSLIARVARDGPRVTFTSPFAVKRAAAFYIEWGGLFWIAPNAIVCLLRKLRFRRQAPHGSDIFNVDLGVQPGLGWGKLERYRSETFRWIHQEAQINISASNEKLPVLLLQLEPGRGFHNRKQYLTLLDENGKIVARRRVRRLKFLRIPLPRAATLTLRLETLDADGGNPTLSAFRVFWCDLETGGPRSSAKEHQASDIQGTVPRYSDPTAATPACSFAFLHTNACGDFTLAAREHWFDLRAYPEFDLFSMNLDSVFCYAAHYGGAREEVLPDPMRIYHIEHARGSGWTPEGQARLFERIASQGLSFIDNQEVLAWAAQMHRLKVPMIFNRENWGLADLDLPETVVSPERPKST